MMMNATYTVKPRVFRTCLFLTKKLRCFVLFIYLFYASLKVLLALTSHSKNDIMLCFIWQELCWLDILVSLCVLKAIVAAPDAGNDVAMYGMMKTRGRNVYVFHKIKMQL